MKDAAAGKEADPTEMSGIMTRGMMKFMPVMTFFVMVSLPGALALYYTISNLTAVAQQQYLLNKDADELDEISDEVIDTPKKSSRSKKSAAERSKKASKANVTRIKAKG